MRLTQFLIFELGTKCNLGELHKDRCPNRSPERWKDLDASHDLDDDMIVSTATRMYQQFGFRGMVGWHYYNEPLLQQERMFGLMRRIRKQVPTARFLLWSNGTLLPADPAFFMQFERIIFTDYGNIDPDTLAAVQGVNPRTLVCRWALDRRMDITGPEHPGPCGRMFVEFVVDGHGNVHLCCYDWKGKGSPGNVYTHKLQVLVTRWQNIRDAISGNTMKAMAPMVCRTCRVRNPAVPAILHPTVFLPTIAAEAQKHVEALRRFTPQPGPAPKPRPQQPQVAVVFASYQNAKGEGTPYRRLLDHFRWNDDLYRSTARVYVVTEKHRNLPDYAECVIFPEANLPILDGERCFSICMTKNAGIRKALADGADVVICTDVDMAFSGNTWEQMVNLKPRQVSIPVYVMAPSFEDREKGQADRGATGTVAMTAVGWQTVCRDGQYYDERCVGYGADDGIMVTTVKQAGLQILRDCVAYHIEHPGATPKPNRPGRGRPGCYGRDGFNPDNFKANKQIHLQQLRKWKR